MLKPKDIVQRLLEAEDEDDIGMHFDSLVYREPRITIRLFNSMPSNDVEDSYDEFEWVEEEGESMWPTQEERTARHSDDDDESYTFDVVEKTVRFLISEKAVIPSADHYHTGAWYTTHDLPGTRGRTRIWLSYALVDFTKEEEKAIWFKMRNYSEDEDEDEDYDGEEDYFGEEGYFGNDD